VSKGEKANAISRRKESLEGNEAPRAVKSIRDTVEVDGMYMNKKTLAGMNKTWQRGKKENGGGHTRLPRRTRRDVRRAEGGERLPVNRKGAEGPEEIGDGESPVQAPFRATRRNWAKGQRGDEIDEWRTGILLKIKKPPEQDEKIRRRHQV